MFDFWNNNRYETVSKPVAVSEPKAITVEDVHREFLTASDKLIEDVNNYLLKAKANKAKRLERFGFMSSVDVVESVDFLRKQRLSEIVQKYQFTHPNNKVITHDKVYEICKKYNLIHCESKRYTGFVPEKNLKEIEDFKFQEGYTVYLDDYSKNQIMGTFKTIEEAQVFAEELNIKDRESWRRYIVDDPIKRLTICAPKDKVKLYSGEKIEGNKIVVPDPIVLHEIEENCYLIVTAWGDEASDPEIVNEKMN